MHTMGILTLPHAVVFFCPRITNQGNGSKKRFCAMFLCVACRETLQKESARTSRPWTQKGFAPCPICWASTACYFRFTDGVRAKRQCCTARCPARRRARPQKIFSVSGPFLGSQAPQDFSPSERTYSTCSQSVMLS